MVEHLIKRFAHTDIGENLAAGVEDHRAQKFGSALRDFFLDSPSIFERAEIKHALAYLRLLDNPRDDTSFLRVVNFPPRGIGARTVEQLQDAARAQGSALADAAAERPERRRAVVAVGDLLLDGVRAMLTS